MAKKYRTKNSAVLLFTTSTGTGRRFSREMTECKLHGPKCDRRSAYCEEALRNPEKWGYR